MVELHTARLVQGQQRAIQKHQMLFLERQRKTVDDTDEHGVN